MKKLFCITMVLALALGTLAGCGGEVVEGIDPNRTQIYVSLFDGGYGSDWLYDVKYEFEEDYPDYQVMIDLNKTENATIRSSLQSHSTNTNIFFTSAPYLIKEMISLDLLEDLSDVYGMRPDGEGASTVQEKIKNYSQYETAFTLDGKEGIYALPYGDSFTGFVYNHDLFMDRGWLLTDNGQWLIQNQGGQLSDGKDDIPGTFDDGHPETIEQWVQLLNLIVASGDTVPFIWSYNYAYAYTNPILYAILAQYEGVDNYQTFMDYEGTYSRTGEEITLEEGYKVYDMEGVSKALEFFGTYVGGSGFYHDSVTSSSSHADAQNSYLFNQISPSTSNKQAAFLIEGIWWENEARASFLDMPEGQQYGESEYNYMLLPTMDGQLSTKSVVAAQDTGMTIIAKNDNEELVDMCKTFVLYTLKDRNLRDFTVNTGALKPYNYTLDSTDIENMTPFARNVWEIYTDTEHVEVVRPEIAKLSSAMNYGTSKSSELFTASVQSSVGAARTVNTPLQVFTADENSGRVSWSEYLAGVKSYNSASSWAEWVTEYNEYISQLG